MNTRQKGMQLANHIADSIVKMGIDPKARADVGSGAGNREKSDISTTMMIFGQQAGIEAKNQSRVNMKEAWKQTCKLETLGCEPILVYKEFGEPLEESKAVIYLDTLLRLVKSSQASKTAPQEVITPQDDRTLHYAIQTLRIALSKVDKLLP